MMAFRKLTVTLVVTVASFAAAASAFAESPGSDAAQACADSSQIDYYQVIGGTDGATPVVDFGNLAHGSDVNGTYVIATNHGDCVSFIAKNTKGKSSSTNGQEFLQIKLTDVVVTSISLS